MVPVVQLMYKTIGIFQLSEGVPGGMEVKQVEYWLVVVCLVLRLGCLETCFDHIPVDHRWPTHSPVGHFGSVHIVCMFPLINAQEGLPAGTGLQGVLIGACLGLDASDFGVIAQPTPSAALDCQLLWHPFQPS